MSKNKWLIIILLFALFTRIFRISYPTTYYFDEVYHAFTASAYANNDPKGYEWWHKSPVEGTAYEWLHPPLSKLFMGLSVKVFGDNSFGWRFPSVIFGVMTIWAIYLLTKKITKSEQAAIIAALVSCFDGLLLTQSRIAMNDIYVTFFILMSFFWFWEYKTNKTEWRKALILSGIFAGLSMASKWSGIFVLGVYGLIESIEVGAKIVKRKFNLLQIALIGVFLLLFGLVLLGVSHISFDKDEWLMKTVNILIPLFGSLFVLLISKIFPIKKLLLMILAWIIIPFLIYFLSYTQFFIQGHTLDQFRELHNQIVWYQTHLTATHSYQSTPWQWILNLKPVWYFVDYYENGNLENPSWWNKIGYKESLVGNIYALANPLIAWMGLASIIYFLLNWVIDRDKKSLYIICCYFFVWAPWILSPRIMFFYHYTPGVALLCVSLGYLFSQWWKNNIGKKLAITSIIVFGVLFVYFYPHWTGIGLPTTLTNQYYWIESWR